LTFSITTRPSEPPIPADFNQNVGGPPVFAFSWRNFLVRSVLLW
jgi:hypothetical protein